MSFRGYFEVRPEQGGHRTDVSATAIEATSDRQIARIERTSRAGCTLVAEVRADDGRAALADCFNRQDQLRTDPGKLAAFSGDFSFALIDERKRTLVLGLAPLTELELYYRLDSRGHVSFSTALPPLLDHGEQAELDMLAKALRFEAFFDDQRAFYKGVLRVQPGTIVEFSGNGRAVRRFWNFDPEPIDIGEAAAADQLRALTEQAVASRLGAVAGAKGCCLSAGRDSSTVMAIAAFQLGQGGESLDAWTAAALAGAPTSGRHLLDEAPLAAITSSKFHNVAHHVLRPERFDLCAMLDRIHAAVAVPVLQPLAAGWCEPLWDASEAAGNRLLLGAGFGNYALSAGGLAFLEDVRLESGVPAWAACALSAAAVSPSRLPSLGRAMLWRRRTRPAGRVRRPLGRFLRGPLRQAWLEDSDARSGEPQSYRQWLRAGIRVSIDSNDLAHLGRQLEMTDPTRDRRLVEFIHSLPARLLAGPNDRRPIFERAFADLLPDEVLRPRLRGRQNADWHHSFGRDDLERGLARYRQSPGVCELVDCEALGRILDRWPSKRTLAGPLFEEMVWGALPALSMASFLFSRGE
jgi:asparagine synthase (glutamine-hydrolysing)